MAQLKKTYDGLVSFETIEIRIKAKNKREARKKIRKIAINRKPKIDKNNFWIDEV